MPESIKDIVVKISARKEGFESLDSAAADVNNLTNNIKQAEAATMSWAQFIKGKMGPYMKEGFAQGLSHADAHTAAIRRIGAEWKEYKASGQSAVTVTQQVATANQQAAVATQSFADRISASAHSLQQVGHMGQVFMASLDRIEISQLNVANAQATLASAQVRYNEAVTKYGENSREAFIANNELVRSQNNLDKANMGANISLGMIGVTMVGQIPLAVKFATNMIAQLKKVEIATMLTTARIRAMAPELLILSALAGGLYYLSTQAARAQTATDLLGDSLTSNFSNAREEAERLRREVETLQERMRSAAMRAEQRQIEFQATIAAITAGPGSAAEKAKLIEQERLRYARDLLKIEQDGARIAWEKADADGDAIIAAKAKAEYQQKELEIQRLINTERTKAADVAATGVRMRSYTGAGVPTPSVIPGATFQPSRTLEESLAKVQGGAEIKKQVLALPPRPKFEPERPYMPMQQTINIELDGRTLERLMEEKIVTTINRGNVT